MQLANSFSSYGVSYLRLYDGNNTQNSPLIELTGYEIPNNISICGNDVLLEFSSSYKVSSGYSGKIHVTDAPQRPELGELGYCGSSCLCGANEGPCESNDQCKNGHMCVLDSCPSSLGLPNGTSCCQDMICGYAELRSGSFFSPNYPNSYKEHQLCYHHISVEPGKIIMIEFNSFDVSTYSFIMKL